MIFNFNITSSTSTATSTAAASSTQEGALLPTPFNVTPVTESQPSTPSASAVAGVVTQVARSIAVAKKSNEVDLKSSDGITTIASAASSRVLLDDYREFDSLMSELKPPEGDEKEVDAIPESIAKEILGVCTLFDNCNPRVITVLELAQEVQIIGTFDSKSTRIAAIIGELNQLLLQLEKIQHAVESTAETLAQIRELHSKMTNDSVYFAARPACLVMMKKDQTSLMSILEPFPKEIAAILNRAEALNKELETLKKDIEERNKKLTDGDLQKHIDGFQNGPGEIEKINTDISAQIAILDQIKALVTISDYERETLQGYVVEANKRLESAKDLTGRHVLAPAKMNNLEKFTSKFIEMLRLKSEVNVFRSKVVKFVNETQIRACKSPEVESALENARVSLKAIQGIIGEAKQIRLSSYDLEIRRQARKLHTTFLSEANEVFLRLEKEIVAATAEQEKLASATSSKLLFEYRSEEARSIAIKFHFHRVEEIKKLLAPASEDLKTVNAAFGKLNSDLNLLKHRPRKDSPDGKETAALKPVFTATASASAASEPPEVTKSRKKSGEFAFIAGGNQAFRLSLTGNEPQRKRPSTLSGLSISGSNTLETISGIGALPEESELEADLKYIQGFGSRQQTSYLELRKSLDACLQDVATIEETAIILNRLSKQKGNKKTTGPTLKMEEQPGSVRTTAGNLNESALKLQEKFSEYGSILKIAEDIYLGIFKMKDEARRISRSTFHGNDEWLALVRECKGRMAYLEAYCEKLRAIIHGKVKEVESSAANLSAAMGKAEAHFGLQSMPERALIKNFKGQMEQCQTDIERGYNRFVALRTLTTICNQLDASIESRDLEDAFRIFKNTLAMKWNEFHTEFPLAGSPSTQNEAQLKDLVALYRSKADKAKAYQNELEAVVKQADLAMEKMKKLMASYGQRLEDFDSSIQQDAKSAKAMLDEVTQEKSAKEFADKTLDSEALGKHQKMVQGELENARSLIEVLDKTLPEIFSKISLAKRKWELLQTSFLNESMKVSNEENLTMMLTIVKEVEESKKLVTQIVEILKASKTKIQKSKDDLLSKSGAATAAAGTVAKGPSPAAASARKVKDES